MLGGKSLNKKDTQIFISKYALTLEDERGDGIVTYIFNEREYTRYKNYEKISSGAWRFTNTGTLRIFNKDIKLTWRIKLGKDNNINIKAKFDPLGKLYPFEYKEKVIFLNELKDYQEAKLNEKKRLEQEKLDAQKKVEEEKLALQKKAEEEKKRLEQEKLEAQKKAEEEKKRLEQEKLEAQKKAEEEKAKLEKEIAEQKRELEEEKAKLEKEIAEQKKKLEEEKLEAQKKTDDENKFIFPQYVSNHTEELCKENWTKRGVLDERMFDYCSNLAVDGYREALEIYKEYENAVWIQDVVNFSLSEWTKRGITDYNMFGYEMKKHKEGFLNLEYEINQNNVTEAEVRKCSDKWYPSFNMIVYCLKK